MTYEQLNRGQEILSELDQLNSDKTYLANLLLDKQTDDCSITFNYYNINTMESDEVKLECIDKEFAEKIRQLFQEYINSKMEQLITEFEQL